MLIVDDSILEKAHTDADELVYIHYDHIQQCFIRGLDILSLLYQAGDLALSIAAEFVQQTTYQSATTKNEYLQQMLRVAQ